MLSDQIADFDFPLSFRQVILEDFEYPTVNWKYADLDFVLNHESTKKALRSIISQCPLQRKHKRILIDVKVQNLVPEKTSCIPGWHLDGPENPLHNSKPEIHHLYIRETGGETEFINQKLSFEHVHSETKQSELVKQIPHNVSITKARAGYFTTFSRFNFHRGIHVKNPMKRILVRLTETDTIRPRNIPIDRFYGG
jgi:hypothetical protein